MSDFSGLLNNWLDQSASSSYDSVNIQQNQVKKEVKHEIEEKKVKEELPPISNNPKTRIESGLSQNQWNLKKEQEKKVPVQAQTQKNDLDVSNMNPQEKQQANMNPRFEFDRHLLGWMRSSNTGFLISSYKTHKVFSIGVVRDPKDGTDKLSLWITHFNRPMGIHASPTVTWVSSSGNLWRFENSGPYEDESESNLGLVMEVTTAKIDLLQKQGKDEELTSLIETLLKKTKRQKDKKDQIEILLIQGNLAKQQRRFEEAISIQKDALAVAEEENYLSLIADCYRNLGSTYFQFSRFN